jgi:hypothetical protein
VKPAWIALLLFIAQLPSKTPQEQAKQYPLVLSMEDEPGANTSAIPSQIWRVLIADRDVQTVSVHQDPPLSEPPRSWFAAFPVSLHGEGDSDFVVQAEDRLRGANVTTFWVFLQTTDGPKLVLTLPAHDLTVENVRSHGYRKIEAGAATAVKAWTKTFCFNGSEYAPCGKC